MEYHGNISENDGNSYEKISMNTHRVSWMFFFTSFWSVPVLDKAACLLRNVAAAQKNGP